MKTAVVTGANGLIGRYLVKTLAKNEYKVYAIVRNKEEDISCIKDIPNMRLIYCELDEIHLLKEHIKEKIEVFFHLAWAGSSGQLRSDYKLQLWNAEKACDAVKVSYALGCQKFVGIGSVVELVLRNNVVQDDFFPAPESNYAIAKMTANYLCKSMCKRLEVEFNWLYVANLYGVGDTTQNIVNYVAKKYIAGEIPELTAGDQLADFIYVSDVAKAIRLVGENGKNGVSYYVGGNNVKPLKEFILAIRDAINPNLESGLGRKVLVGQSIDFNTLDITKIQMDTGFTPDIKLEEGIQKTVEWLMKRESLNYTRKEENK